MLPPTTFSDLNDDVLLEICGYLHGQQLRVKRKVALPHLSTPIKNLSLMNRRLRDLVLPLLFKRIRICGASILSRNGKTEEWQCAREIIQTLCHNPVLLTYIKAAKFDIYYWGDPDVLPLAKDVNNLAQFLKKLPYLRSLNFCMPHHQFRLCRAAFESLSFPNITSLAVDPTSSFIIHRCPNVMKVVIAEAVQSWNYHRGWCEKIERVLDMPYAEELCEQSPSNTTNKDECPRFMPSCKHPPPQITRSKEAWRAANKSARRLMSRAFRERKQAEEIPWSYRHWWKDSQSTVERLADMDIPTLKELWIGGVLVASKLQLYGENGVVEWAWTWTEGWVSWKEKVQNVSTVQSGVMCRRPCKLTDGCK